MSRFLIKCELIRPFRRTLSTTPALCKAHDKEIVVPTYIPRDSTAILKALSNTVGVDHTAAHFKYQDDPYLIPTSNVNKRIFALAQESGRKAAKWVKQEHADLFLHSVADPPVKSFMTDIIFTEQTEVTETLLKNLIKQCEVADSIAVFQLLEKNNVVVDPETKQQLLELVCFYNGENSTSEEWIEERWFKQSMTGRERMRKTWKDHDLSERLFQNMEVKTSAAYNAIIRGMCKYYHAEKAWYLFETALKDNVSLDVETYNAIIVATNFLAEKDAKWEKLKTILNLMNDNGIIPNTITLNNSLSALSSIFSKQVRGWALSILAEFKKYPHIQPSLATWYFMLIIFCRDNGPTSHILVNILDELEGKAISIQDPRDIFFFVTAMDVCCNHLQDKDVANRVDKLLHTANNYNLIGDSFKESIYYRHYFNLLCQTEPLEVFMETYHRLVPYIYVPEPSVMESILRLIEMESAIDLIPQIWSHMVIFDHTGRENLLNLVLRIMTQNPDINVELVTKFGEISWEIWQKIEDMNENQNLNVKINWNGTLLGSILKLLCRCDNYENATKVFHKLDKEQSKIVGVADRGALEEFIKIAVKNKEPSLAVRALQYSVENGHEKCSSLGSIIIDGLKLDSIQLSKIQTLVKN